MDTMTAVTFAARCDLCGQSVADGYCPRCEQAKAIQDARAPQGSVSAPVMLSLWGTGRGAVMCAAA